ncbi:MAG: DUF2382 domain-containing protein [Chloroflexi bacterium]|nr:DUF2382 domain-containing protein [Chloroflexota bacterium]
MEEARQSRADVPSSAGAGARLELREEEVQQRPYSREVGRVRIRRRVITELRRFEIPVQREELVVERADLGDDQQYSGAEAAAPEPFQVCDLEPGQVIQLDLLEEDIIVQKRAVVFERVEVGKRHTSTLEPVNVELQREQLRVDSPSGREHVNEGEN